MSDDSTAYEEEGCCLGAKKRIRVPPVELTVISPEFAQARYDAIVHEGPCCYRNDDLALPPCRRLPCGSTIFPLLCPQAFCAPCCALGKTVSLMHHEVKCCSLHAHTILSAMVDDTARASTSPVTQDQADTYVGRNCGLGPKGIAVSVALCPLVTFSGCACSVAAMVLTSTQRGRIIDKYGLKREGLAATECAFFCYPCALWRHMAFLKESTTPPCIKPTLRPARAGKKGMPPISSLVALPRSVGQNSEPGLLRQLVARGSINAKKLIPV